MTVDVSKVAIFSATSDTLPLIPALVAERVKFKRCVGTETYELPAIKAVFVLTDNTSLKSSNEVEGLRAVLSTIPTYVPSKRPLIDDCDLFKTIKPALLRLPRLVKVA